MATLRNGSANGVVNKTGSSLTPDSRFSDVPKFIDIPVGGEGEVVEVQLLDTDLDDPTELCQLLEAEQVRKDIWFNIALAHAKTHQIDNALQILTTGLKSLSKSGPKDRLALLSGIAWLNLLKSRHAPRIKDENSTNSETKTKDDFLREATQNVNDGLRLNPAYSPLALLRGVLLLLKASLETSRRTGPSADAERAAALKDSLKFFEDAIKTDGRNMVAKMGQARVLYMQGRYALSLQSYQEALSRMPSMTEPDPRLGIGCCLWQLGYHEKASAAWSRSLELNHDSKVAHALLGVYYLRESSKFPASDPQYIALYKKAMQGHLLKAYNLDKNFPLSASAFATYFLLTNRIDRVEPLARIAINQTDVNSLVSDGWYVLARKEQNAGEFVRATEYYTRSDAARGATDRAGTDRGGIDKGYLPAKFGLTQLAIKQNENLETAKLTLEKMSNNRNVEATTLLGCLLAEEVFSSLRTNPKEDRSALAQRAAKLLEIVRKQWKDENSRVKPDETVLLYLARLYEEDRPLESMKCLQQVESMQLDKIPEEERPDTSEEEAVYSALLREHLPPQLLNNVACHLYAGGSFETARETFQIALNACVKLAARQEAEREAAQDGELDAEDVDNSDTDALVTTISYNLARTYEELTLHDEAQKVYKGLLERHPDYTDAQARLTYMSLEASPRGQGPKEMLELYSSDSSNLEVRSLMGWYHHGSKKRVNNLNEDVEYRQYKHTLQHHDKHDFYSLTGMGNIHLTLAREMPRNNDVEKDKRTKMYIKAFEFFDKALQLDPKNAYAAQGIAIALCDDKRSYSDALQIFTKVKDTIRDASVYTNLGHVMYELHQYQRAIDNYELAIQKDTEKLGSASRGENLTLLACLSRAWLSKGRNDKSISSLNTALEYMNRALAAQPDAPHLRWNVAYIQFTIATIMPTIQAQDRTIEDVDAAIAGLQQAIETFEDVALGKNPPYPKDQLQQRAMMGRNTTLKAVNKERESQARYEQEHKVKFEEARARREEELKRREEAQMRKKEEEEQKRQKVAEERQRIVEDTAKAAAEMREEAVRREAELYTSDEEGKKVKRASKKKRGGLGGAGGDGAEGGKRKRSKRDDDVDGFIEDDDVEGESGRSVSRTPATGDSDDDGGAPSSRAGSEKPRKKRRLERKARPEPKRSKPARKPAARDTGKKFKSEAVVVDSDEEDEPVVGTPGTDDSEEEPRRRGRDEDGDEELFGGGGDGDEDEDEDDIRKPVSTPARKRKQLRTIADDDDDEDEDGEGGGDVKIGNADLAAAALAATDGGAED